MGAGDRGVETRTRCGWHGHGNDLVETPDNPLHHKKIAHHARPKRRGSGVFVFAATPYCTVCGRLHGHRTLQAILAHPRRFNSWSSDRCRLSAWWLGPRSLVRCSSLTRRRQSWLTPHRTIAVAPYPTTDTVSSPVPVRGVDGTVFGQARDDDDYPVSPNCVLRAKKQRCRHLR